MANYSQLLEIVGEVFASKADHHEMDVVSAFFADRPDLFQDLYENKHEVFLGRRGTGKTMVLKHLSFDSRLHRSPVPLSHPTFAVDFIGFYVPLALEDQPIVGPENDLELQAIFGHWFNLVTLIPALDAIAVLKNSPQISHGALNTFAKEVGNQIFGYDCIDLSSLQQWIRQQEKDIRDCCNWPRVISVEKADHYLRMQPKITTTRSFHTTLTGFLSTLLAPLFSGKPRFFFLLDRFDEVCAERQRVVQHVVQVHPGQAYYIKLGVTHATKLHLVGVTSQDCRILNIEHDINSVAYEAFCEAVLKRRFAVIREKLKAQEIDVNIVKLFEDPQQLLPNLSFDEQARSVKAPSSRQIALWNESPGKEAQAFQKLLAADQIPIFSGIQHLAALSSGCIRIFIEITHRVIAHALLKNPEVVVAEQAIPPDLQHQAIEIETEQRHSQELKTNICATTKDSEVQTAAHKLIEWLLRQFAKSLNSGSVAAHLFALQNNVTLSDEKEQRLRDALVVLDLLGLITERTPQGTRPSENILYSVARTFAPKYKTPPIECGCLNITTEDLRSAIDPHRSQRIVPDLPLTEQLNCFYATGFRSPWENALRDHFRQHAFPHNHLRYMDGEDEHVGSRQIGRAVQNLISTAAFLIAEISDFNENVCFEMGQCVALELWFYGIKNRLSEKQAPNETIKEMLDSLKYDRYDLTPEPTSFGDTQTWDFKSADEVVKKISDRFRKLTDKKRKAVNPFDNNQRLGLIRESRTRSIFLYADETELMATWLQDFEGQIMTDLRSNVTRDQGSSYNGSYTLKYLEAIARSSHCIIDITNKNPYCGFLLGYTVGREKKHLAVWRRGTNSLITNYRGEAGKNEYDNKDELWQVIRNFVQSPP
jgi:hypothetical protein